MAAHLHLQGLFGGVAETAVSKSSALVIIPALLLWYPVTKAILNLFHQISLL
jgi:hypothetical protein